MAYKQFCFISSLIFPVYYLTLVNSASSQIVPDHTTNTSIINDCQSGCQITGGQVAGQNLFHSFQEFGIRQGETVNFADPGVTNIFSRVTGQNPSHLFGTLGVSGDANLFLLNPNGIIFGAGAALDLNGSFLATTADSIQFGDRHFSALPDSQENLALLTVNPNALFFNQMGQNDPILLDYGALLTVPEQQNITLVGSQVQAEEVGLKITGSLIQAPQGNVSLAAVYNQGQIELTPDLKLKLTANTIPGDISLAQNSVVDVSGNGGGNIQLQGRDVIFKGQSKLTAFTLGNVDGGEINLEARNLTLTENSEIATASFGKGASADMKIKAAESVIVQGQNLFSLQRLLVNALAGNNGDINNNPSSAIYTFSVAQGTAGDIMIDSQNLEVANGARILATTYNQGATGNLTINASEDVTIDGSGLLLASASDSRGDVGRLNLNSKNLLLKNGGIISSSTLGSGHGGSLNLTVSDSIHLKQSLPNGFVPTGIYSNTVLDSGSAGNVNLNTGNLILEDGAQLSSSSGLLNNQGLIAVGGEGGNITLQVGNLLEISGNSADGRFFSGIVNNTFSDRPAGDISIHTGILNLKDQGTISASAIGEGNGGNLTIVADEGIFLTGLGFDNLELISIQGLTDSTQSLDIRGGLLTITLMGEAGDISITTPELALSHGALITTASLGQGNGGNLKLATDKLEVLASAIASATLGTGQAGDIEINTNSLITKNSGVIVSSGVGLGNAGDVKIDARDFIRLADNQRSFLISGGIFTSSIGLSYPGNLEITTKELEILGGNQINASNGMSSIAIDFKSNELLDNLDLSQLSLDFDLSKNLTINAESITIAGSSTNNLLNSGTINEFSSGIITTTNSPFTASNIAIQTSDLNITDGGEISVKSVGSGKAGNLDIIANSIKLDDRATLNGSTLSGTGGNINLKVQDTLSVANNSQIITNAEGIGDGGNITIDTTFAIAYNNSKISATALSGQGGNIKIFATDVFVDFDSLISASSELGIDGTVKISTFNTAKPTNVNRLPQKVLEADRLITQGCGARGRQKDVFTYTGRGGLPLNPIVNHPTENMLIADFELPVDEQNESKWKISDRQLNLTSNSSTSKIVEAEKWRINSNGKVELVATINKQLVLDQGFASDCPFNQNK